MGSVCCVAAKDRTITSGPAGDVLSRNIRHSPSWSFRWENRGRVAGEDTSVTWLSDGNRSNDRVDVKSRSTLGTANTSGESSPLDSFRSMTWQKSSASHDFSGPSRLPSTDLPDSRFHKESDEVSLSPTISNPSPPTLSHTTPSVFSVSTSPLFSKGHPLPVGSTPRGRRYSPGHRLIKQVSDSRVPGFRSPTFSISEEASSLGLPCWSNELTGGSNAGSSDSWSIPTFPKYATSRRERWSFDSESFGFVRDKIRISTGLSSGSISFDLRSCGICTKLLSEKSSFGSQKMIGTNELAVSAVLPCAHVYHAECLENMTSEVNKYDPLCPICTFGENQALKMSEKVLRAKMDLRTRKSISRIVDRDLSGNVLGIGLQRSDEPEGGGPKLSSSSGTKRSFGKPFLRSSFSFGSKGSNRSSSNSSSRKRVLFWTKSSKA